METAVYGLILISCLTVGSGPLTVYFLVRHLKEAQAQFISHLDSRPVVIGKPESLHQAELEIERKKVEIQAAKVDHDSALKFQSFQRRRAANQNGASAAEVIEHGP